MNKLFKLDVILFSVALLILWICFASYMEVKPFIHAYTDQHTRQAMAWRQGKIYLDENVSYLELAEYKDKIYVSFPPTPTLIALPLTLIFHSNTPNTIVLLVFTWISLLMCFYIFNHLTGNRLLSFFLAFSFFWGSQILYLSMEGSVHYQGQLYGLFFVLLAFLLTIKSTTTHMFIFVGLSLGFAVGCRPFHLFYTPFIVFIASRKYSIKKVIFFTVIGLIPMGIFISIYNFIRFESIFEFGHNYLPITAVYMRAQFGFQYLLTNIYHTFINLPTWSSNIELLTFSGSGTAFWLVSPILIMGVPYFFIKGIEVEEKIFVGCSFVFMWFLLLLHNTNGWYQFGYRYIVDLIPFFIYFCGRYKRKIQYWMILLAALSILINIYGVYWKYLSPFNAPIAPL